LNGKELDNTTGLGRIAAVNCRAPKGFLVNHKSPTPCVFVSVASKGLSHTASLLFATLGGRIIGVASKGVRGISLTHSYKC
jgi:hypothetical protein